MKLMMPVILQEEQLDEAAHNVLEANTGKCIIIFKFVQRSSHVNMMLTLFIWFNLLKCITDLSFRVLRCRTYGFGL